MQVLKVTTTTEVYLEALPDEDLGKVVDMGIAETPRGGLSDYSWELVDVLAVPSEAEIWTKDGSSVKPSPHRCRDHAHDPIRFRCAKPRDIKFRDMPGCSCMPCVTAKWMRREECRICNPEGEQL